MPTEFWPNAILSLVPTVFIGLLFWFVIRSIIRMDRREREVAAKVEAEERKRARLPARPPHPDARVMSPRD